MLDDKPGEEAAIGALDAAALATPAFRWMAVVEEAKARGADTAEDVEAMLQRLGGQLEAISSQLEVRRQSARMAAQTCAAEAQRLARIDEQIGSFRQARAEASQKVESLTKMQANEVKAIGNRPPRMVRRATEALYTVLNCGRWKDSEYGQLDVTTDWWRIASSAMDIRRNIPEAIWTGGSVCLNECYAHSQEATSHFRHVFENACVRIQQMLTKTDFVQSVVSFDVATLEAVPHVAEFVAERYFPSVQLKQCLLSPPSSPPDTPLRRPLLASPAATEDFGVADNTAAANSELTEPLSGAPAEEAPAAKTDSADGSVVSSSTSAPGSSRTSSRPLSQRNAAPAYGAAARLLAPQQAAIPSLTVRRSSKAKTHLGLQRPSTLARQRSRASTRQSVGVVPAAIAQTTPFNVEPLDVAAVEYASQACGALAKWALEVLREYFALRELRHQQDKWRAHAEASAARQRESEAEVARLEEEESSLMATIEAWRGRLVELRAKELDAEHARKNLAKLSRLEKQCPRPFSRSGRGDRLHTLLQPMSSCFNVSASASSLPRGASSCVDQEDPSFSSPPAIDISTRRRGHGVSSATTSGRRNYLHIMSAPVLCSADGQPLHRRSTRDLLVHLDAE